MWSGRDQVSGGLGVPRAAVAVSSRARTVWDFPAPVAPHTNTCRFIEDRSDRERVSAGGGVSSFAPCCHDQPGTARTKERDQPQTASTSPKASVISLKPWRTRRSRSPPRHRSPSPGHPPLMIMGSRGALAPVNPLSRLGLGACSSQGADGAEDATPAGYSVRPGSVRAF